MTNASDYISTLLRFALLLSAKHCEALRRLPQIDVSWRYTFFHDARPPKQKKPSNIGKEERLIRNFLRRSKSPFSPLMQRNVSQCVFCVQTVPSANQVGGVFQK